MEHDIWCEVVSDGCVVAISGKYLTSGERVLPKMLDVVTQTVGKFVRSH